MKKEEISGILSILSLILGPLALFFTFAIGWPGYGGYIYGIPALILGILAIKWGSKIWKIIGIIGMIFALVGILNLTAYILKEKKTYKIGDEIKANDLVLTVYNFKDYVSNESLSVCFPDIEENCIAVEVGVKNIGESSQGVYSVFSLWYIKKNEKYYSSTPNKGYYFTPYGLFLEEEISEFKSIPIPPGQEIKGTLIFKIPREASGLRLRWMPYFRPIPRIWIDLKK